MFPEIKLTDTLSIPTYLLYLSVLYCCLVLYVVRRAKNLEKDQTIALDLALIMMVGGFLGGRIFHIVYEMPAYYMEDWTRIFQVWQGGFVFFGGFLVALACCFIFTRYKKISFLEWADFYAPVLALGYGLGRISCFLAGCCYGKVCTLPWAMVFAWDFHGIPRHPTQLYAVFWELAVFAILQGLEYKKILRKKTGALFFIWMVFHGLGRLMMEHYRDDFRGSLIFGLSVSGWISIALVAVGFSFLSTFIGKSKSA